MKHGSVVVSEDDFRRHGTNKQIVMGLKERGGRMHAEPVDKHGHVGPASRILRPSSGFDRFD